MNDDKAGAVVKGDGSQFFSHTCPRCGEIIKLQAGVSKFLVPKEWDFYGKPGARVAVCKDKNFIHFAVMVDGGVNHRLAWIIENERVQLELGFEVEPENHDVFEYR